ncbi:MAG TPA: AraC family transcriptional regulator [Acidimicrobiales bacterium]|nr:AraC family transcriptional regulator [Acidimicrobiales bacterium]
MTDSPRFDHLRISGAIFLRAEYTEPWAYEAVDGPSTAAMLHPGAANVVLFHLVAAGRCWIAVGDGDRHWAEAGDVILLPYGDQHAMGGTEPAETVSILSFMDPPPWDSFPVLRLGQGGSRTDVVCGYLHCDDALFDPSLRTLPEVLVVRPDDAAAQWVRASIEYAMAAGSEVTRLPELLLAEVLRLHLATAPAADHGLFAALRDPVLAPALAAIHGQPERKWTVAELANHAAAAPSTLDARFREVLRRSPIRYLTDWRMHVAADLLASTRLTVFEIARRVGYDAEEAFSRAFKRARGTAPSAWRESVRGA